MTREYSSDDTSKVHPAANHIKPHVSPSFAMFHWLCSLSLSSSARELGVPPEGSTTEKALISRWPFQYSGRPSTRPSSAHHPPSPMFAPLPLPLGQRFPGGIGMGNFWGFPLLLKLGESGLLIVFSSAVHSSISIGIEFV